MKKISIQVLLLAGSILAGPLTSHSQTVVPAAERARTHHEVQEDKYMPPPAGTRKTSAGYRVNSAGFFTRQVNVNSSGQNIIGDAANEPSIAVNPRNPNHIVIGWRQFDNVTSNFRQAGYGYSTDGGQSWTFPGVIDPQVFRSDPVLGSDSSGNFFYNSLTNVTGAYTCKVYKSTNGGATWDAGTDAYGGDKQWMIIDRTSGQGSGNIYSFWTEYYSSCQPGFMTRSANAGVSFESCVYVEGYPYWGTMAIGPAGELYIAGAGSSDGINIAKSSNAPVPGSTIAWDLSAYVSMDGYLTSQSPINPVGLLGQVSVDVDRSSGPGHGNVYVLASVHRISNGDPGDVMFSRSTDGWLTFDPPQQINTDASTTNTQWLGTMSVAPNGRIDVVWLDTRDDFSGGYLSALYYCYSDDQGQTWSINKKISEQFDPQVGYPQQSKMGDYFHMISDNTGAHLAWSATLNGEEDVYYTHIIPTIVGMSENPGQKLLSLTCQPNPFSDRTTIRYKISGDCFVKLVVCNVYGEVVRTLVEQEQPAGTYPVVFGDENLPAGFYFCRLSSGTHTLTSRMIKLK